jgi:hypothetical protein
MKRGMEKSKKRHPSKVSNEKPLCGTLSYLAECRGMTPNPPSTRLPEHRNDIKKNVRKTPQE